MRTLWFWMLITVARGLYWLHEATAERFLTHSGLRARLEELLAHAAVGRAAGSPSSDAG